MKDFFKLPRSSLDGNARKIDSTRGAHSRFGRGSIKTSVMVIIIFIIFLMLGAFFLLQFLDSIKKDKENAAKLIWKGSALILTKQGLLQGFNPAKGMLSWQGVDYAAAPTKTLRWRNPRPAESWEGIRTAIEPGARAVQYLPLSGTIAGSEDCLHLNIWRPESPNSAIPVYLWIHGGANSSGYSSPGGDYDGMNLARLSGFLVISIDYRLGPLGWFSDPNLVEADSGGNLGLLDIIAALSWVRENAAAFGGDPDKVTIAGESAGASNILALLLSERAKRLFQRAILQSPLDLFSAPSRAREESRLALCRVLVRSDKAADVDAAGIYLDAMAPDEKKSFFLSIEAKDLLTGLNPDAFGMFDWPCLIRDGGVLPAEGLASFASGRYPVKVPLIIGSNHDEVGVFLFSSKEQAALMPIYDKALAWGSAAWGAWVENLAINMAGSRGQPPVSMYRFDWGSPDGDGKSPLPLFFISSLGAFHSLEIPFFLGNDTVAGEIASKLIFNRQNAPGRDALSADIRAYTADFARGGLMRDIPGLPAWPRLPGSKSLAKTAKAGKPTVLGLVFNGNDEKALIRSYSLSAANRLFTIGEGMNVKDIDLIRGILPSFLKKTLK
jgi:para-nitrobenzyl esterase